MELRNYQTAALERVVESLRSGLNRLLIKKPTGTGKTVMFAAMLKFPGIAAWLAELPKGKGARMLVIAHREELLDQAADKLQRSNPGLVVDFEQGERRASPYCDVVLASIQTLQAMKFRRLERLQARHDFRIVVVDEAHHSAAATYRTALVRLGFLPGADASESDEIEAPDYTDVAVMRQALEGWDAVAPKDRLLVGVTATPNRTDAIGLGCVFQTIAYSYALREAISDGWLVPIEPRVVASAINLDAVHTARGDFHQRELAEAVNVDHRNALALAAWLELAERRPTIAFTVDVAHAHEIARRFNEAGVRAAAISGETPKDERRAILREFTQGRIQVLSNCMVLTEGTDLPLTSCILHLKPTKSATLYEQMTGRGLRPYPGKDDCLVIDVVDVARKHSLQTAAVLYGLPPGLKGAGETLDDLEREFERLRLEHPGVDISEILGRERLTLKELQAYIKRFDVWAVPDAGPYKDRLLLDWIKLGDSYRIQYPWNDGTETLSIDKTMLEGYAVACTLRPKGGPPRQRTLAADVPEPLTALTLAESFVQSERRSILKLKAQDATWQKRPASDKQIAVLRRLNVNVRRGITMGEASRLIDYQKARRGR